MMNIKKYSTVKRIFYAIVILYFSVVLLMTIGYFTGFFTPAKIPTDWWSALGVVVTLTLAILIMNFIREKDYVSTQNKITEFEKEIENSKQLSILSTILLDIATEENSNTEKWSKNYPNLENLYKLGFISNIDLYRISLEAWKQNDINFAFRLRQLAFQVKPEILNNKLYLFALLPYVNLKCIEPEYVDEDIRRVCLYVEYFLDEMGFRKISKSPLKYSTEKFFKKHNKVSSSNECFAYALTGRYLFKKKLYKESQYFFELAIEESEKIETFKRWHFRYLLALNLANNDFESLTLNLQKVKSRKEWRNDFRYIPFHNLIENILNIKNGNPTEHLNFLYFLKGINENRFDRFTMWNFSSIIQDLGLEDSKLELIKKLYRKYYVFFGTDDIEFNDNFGVEDIESEKEKYLSNIILKE